MTPDQFREHGRAVVDWIADYWERLETLPVLSQVEAGAVRAALPAHPPEHGEPFADVLADVDRVVVPGLTHWQSPNYFAYFPANASGPAVLGELLSAGLGVQGMLWATSPAATELETHVLDWLVELLDLPAAWRGNGVIQDSASSATLVALLAALHRASDGQVGRTGVDRRYTVYASTQAHSSVEKAVKIAGLGAQNLRLVDVDPQTQALLPERLGELLAADVAAGAVPVMVVAAVGSTSTTAIDPVRRIADVAAPYQAWLHVDAAYAGVAAVCPELRWLGDGLERADSYCTNPHKWLLTNFDCDACYVADRTPLLGALSVLPEYLRNTASSSGAVLDYRDWQIPLGRRFRALKLWFVLRHYGAEGLRAHIRGHVALAQDFAAAVGGDPRFEVVAPHPLSLVCFRLRAGDEATSALVERLNASGELYLTGTRVNGRYAARLAIGAPTTTRRHVEAAWSRIAAAAG